MGGQESPGLFLVIGALFLVGGIILHLTLGTFWQWICYGVGGFVWVQCLVALTDCWGVKCPNCSRPTRPMPWSF